MTTTIYVGDCKAVMAGMAEQSVHCIVTSPPYWALRSYKLVEWIGGDPDCNHVGKPIRGENSEATWDRPGRNSAAYRPVCRYCGAKEEAKQGGIGLEPNFLQYQENMMQVMDECWRVLRNDGTLWLNLGDAYSGSGRGHQNPKSPGLSNSYKRMGKLNRGNKGSHDLQPNKDGSLGIPPKSLMMMPARIALAMQDRGWVLRSEVIWHKSNCMPESVQDRPTNAHEKVFLFAKQKRYFYDHVAVRTERNEDSIARDYRAFGGQPEVPPGAGKHSGDTFKQRENQNKSWLDDAPDSAKALGRPSRQKIKLPGARPNGENLDRNDNDLAARMREKYPDGVVPEGEVPTANLRNVWRLSTSPYKGQHFATFPPSLVETCLKASTSEYGVDATTGTQYERQVERKVNTPLVDVPYGNGQVRRTDGTLGGQGTQHSSLGGQQHKIGETQVGFALPDGSSGDVKPAVVLDPFGGAGTTGLVAERLGRDAILIEISAEYAEMAAERIRQEDTLLTQVNVINKQETT